MKTYLALALTFFSLHLAASGVFMLKGTLKGFTEQTFLVQKGEFVYEVKKDELNADTVKDLKSKKSGAPVEFMLSTTAVKSVTQTK